jgi:hypothetical protein
MAGLLVAAVQGHRLTAQAQTSITIYKSKTCGCCTKWVEYLEARGFKPRVHDEENMDGLKDRIGVPSAVRSCHTAMVDSYLVEGHVPAGDIQRLLEERPRVAGLAVPGMPERTPGMAPPGVPEGGYEVLAFQYDGSTTHFASH